MHTCDDLTARDVPEETEADEYCMFSVSEEEVLADRERFSGLGLSADEAWIIIISSFSFNNILGGGYSKRDH